MSVRSLLAVAVCVLGLAAALPLTHNGPLRHLHGVHSRARNQFIELQQRVNEHQQVHPDLLSDSAKQDMAAWQATAPLRQGTSTLWFTQQLDHFDSQQSATWQQRVFVNDQYWTPSGPVFLYIEGEGAASIYDVMYGNHMEQAKQFGALVFAVEHRYYGASIPTADLSTPNLRYLSSEQALADLATFHEYAVNQYNLTRRNIWVSFGGSYSGALSSWFRLKYPHLVHGAISSSGPVWPDLDFTGYNYVVGQSLSDPIVNGSIGCAQNITQGMQDLQMLLSSGSTGWSKLSQLFHTCEPISSQTSNDTVMFIGNVVGVFQGVVQYNNEEPGLNIGQICSTMQAGPDPLTAIANVVQQGSGGPCLDISYANMVAQLANITADPTVTGVGARQWTYQTCAQFGYYQTCGNNVTECLFASPQLTLASNTDLCWTLFNIDAAAVQRNVAFSAAYYGSNQPDSSRVLFVNGHVDPWHWLSVLSDVPNTSDDNAVFIHGTAHCANMGTAQSTDPPQLTMARDLTASQIGSWIQEAQGGWH